MQKLGQVLLVLVIPALMSCGKTTTGPSASVTESTTTVEPTPPNPNKDFIVLAEDTLDAIDRANAALKLSRPIMQQAELDAQRYIQKLNRTANSDVETRIAGDIAIFHAQDKLCRAQSAGIEDGASSLPEYKLCLQKRDKYHSEALELLEVKR